MSAPQWAVLVIYLASLMWEAYMHGKPKTGYHNFWMSLIAAALMQSIYFWGGFWR